MKLKFPDKYTKIIDQLLSQIGYDLDKPHRLAKAIIGLSNEYNTRNLSANIWASPEKTAAYLCYFFPLNYLRAQRVFLQLQEVGFWNLNHQHWLELGSGCGTAFLAYLDMNESSDLSINLVATATFVESSHAANKIMEKILEGTQTSRHLKIRRPKAEWKISMPNNQTLEKSTLFVASYSLNELTSIPAFIQNSENLLIIDSSLQEQTRKLMKLRQDLISKDYFAWAPCTHQDPCPLLLHSKKDWCFDRFFIEQPSWLQNIETYLPMKNRTLTHSYLAVSRTAPTLSKSFARVIGDTLKEKGKNRQAVCQSSEREFLAWLKKMGTPPTVPRGTLLTTQDLIKVGKELRNCLK